MMGVEINWMCYSMELSALSSLHIVAADRPGSLVHSIVRNGVTARGNASPPLSGQGILESLQFSGSSLPYLTSLSADSACLAIMKLTNCFFSLKSVATARLLCLNAAVFISLFELRYELCHIFLELRVLN